MCVVVRSYPDVTSTSIFFVSKSFQVQKFENLIKLYVAASCRTNAQIIFNWKQYMSSVSFIEPLHKNFQFIYCWIAVANIQNFTRFACNIFDAINVMRLLYYCMKANVLGNFSILFAINIAVVLGMGMMTNETCGARSHNRLGYSTSCVIVHITFANVFICTVYIGLVK